MAVDGGQGRLRWRCRRGMKELDLLLEAWLDRGWPLADEARRLAFDRLLDQADPQLAAWLIGGERPGDSTLARLIDEIIRIRH